MSLLKANKRVSVPELSFKRSTVSRYNGIVAKRVASVVFDTAVNDSAGVSNKTIAAHPLGVFLPNKAIITDVFVDVPTTFTSATDAATIALKVQSANDIVSALAISNASNIWDAGIHGGVIGAYAEATVAGDTAILDAARKVVSMVKLTAEREVTATVAVEALTAGKAVIYIEYYLGE